MKRPSTPPPLDATRHARWTMYGKQLEMEEALAEDWAREYALLRPKIAEALVAAWKAEHAGVKPEDAQVAKWLKWLRAADDKARQGYLKQWFDATEATIEQVAREYQERYIKAAVRFDEALESWRRKFASDIVQQRICPSVPLPLTWRAAEPLTRPTRSSRPRPLKVVRWSSRIVRAWLWLARNGRT